jgi:enoyl-CoA hydratase/carnithine racemase
MAFGRWRHNTSFRLCSFEEALAEEKAKMAQIKLTRPSPRYWRITFDNPPLNLMGPEFVLESREIITTLESDEELRVVVFDSSVEGFFLNHSDFNAKIKDLTDIPQGPTGLEAWPDILVRPRLPSAAEQAPANDGVRNRRGLDF